MISTMWFLAAQAGTHGRRWGLALALIVTVVAVVVVREVVSRSIERSHRPGPDGVRHPDAAEHGDGDS